MEDVVVFTMSKLQTYSSVTEVWRRESVGENWGKDGEKVDVGHYG